MTTTQESAVAVELITVVIDGFEVSVPKGTLIIRAAEKLGIQIPRFCDHPLLAVSYTHLTLPTNREV